MVQVKVSEGILEGEKRKNDYGNPFYSFKGIPYAEPPVGDLRFKAPKPKKTWSGVRQAKQHGPMSYQIYALILQSSNSLPKGSEDCLYLNVYTPSLDPIKPLPVMVFIHGGGFVSGSGNDDIYGPEFLIKNDVILVTFNYRLEVLGFLCLDTEDIPGNAGMKDQVAALRWVKKNIRHFGGDPENITIFGESAGGASVSFHLVSPMSKGLFNRAIMQSGTMTCPWAIAFGARERALLLAQELGCESKNDKEIYEFLKQQPVENFLKRKLPLTYSEHIKESMHIVMTVVAEKKFENQESFFTGDVYDILRNGIHEGVQVINGYTEDEGIVYFSLEINVTKVFEQINNFFEFLVPQPLAIQCSIPQQMDIGKRMKKFYLKDKLASAETIDEFIKYAGMDFFKYSVLSWQKICAKRNKNKIYLYKFSCESDRNIFTDVFGIKYMLPHKKPVSHCDDLTYLFPIGFYLPKVKVNSKSYKMIENITKLWTNFAKYGDPTPDNSLEVKWEPYTIDKQHYLDIDEKLKLKTAPNKEEMEFWEDIFREYYPHMLP